MKIEEVLELLPEDMKEDVKALSEGKQISNPSEVLAKLYYEGYKYGIDIAEGQLL